MTLRPDSDDFDEPDCVDLIGVVFGKNPINDKLYDCYRVSIVDGMLALTQITNGTGRTRRKAMDVMHLDMLAISQDLDRGHVEFVGDEEAADVA
jgi:hypothetical protein